MTMVVDITEAEVRLYAIYSPTVEKFMHVVKELVSDVSDVSDGVWVFEWTDDFNKASALDDGGVEMLLEACRVVWTGGRTLTGFWYHRVAKLLKYEFECGHIESLYELMLVPRIYGEGYVVGNALTDFTSAEVMFEGFTL